MWFHAQVAQKILNGIYYLPKWIPEGLQNSQTFLPQTIIFSLTIVLFLRQLITTVSSKISCYAY